MHGAVRSEVPDSYALTTLVVCIPRGESSRVITGLAICREKPLAECVRVCPAEPIRDATGAEF